MTATTEDLTPATGMLPDDPDMLPDAERALLEPWHLPMWPALNEGTRRRLLARLRREDGKRRRVAEARATKSRLAGEYVEALCGLPKTSDPLYPVAWAELMDRKAAYVAAGGKL